MQSCTQWVLSDFLSLLLGRSSLRSDVHAGQPSSSFQAQFDIALSRKLL